MNKTKTTNVYLENAIKYKEKFRLDFIPLQITEDGKKPNGDKWKYLQLTEQTIDDLKRLRWGGSNALGMINKIILTIDFDKCKDEKFVRIIINELGGKYWLVKTGFGFHLHIRVEALEYLEERLGKSGTIYLYPIDKSILDHIELRIKDCYTAFPPSRHYSGAEYYFIDGEPENLPDFVDSKKLLEVLEKYFVAERKKENDKEEKLDNFYENFNDGVEEGNRHNTLVKLFGSLYSRGIDKKYLTTILKDWNFKNKPPYTEKEILKQINDLFNSYDKGLDGIFLQFNNCLLQLQDDYKLKIEKIICFAVIEYDGDKKIIEELELGDKLTEYHTECKKLVKHYESWTGKKDQIVRIGKALILDAYRKNFRFEYFCIFVGIISYLGRNAYKPAKQIAHNVIRFRAMGFKDEAEYLKSTSQAVPLKESIIRSGIKNIEDRNLLRSFSLVKGRMKWFSTFFNTNEKLAEWVRDREIEKNRKKNEKDLLRVKMQEEIQRELDELNKRTKRTKTNNPSLSSSLHLLSDGS